MTDLASSLAHLAAFVTNLARSVAHLASAMPNLAVVVANLGRSLADRSPSVAHLTIAVTLLATHLTILTTHVVHLSAILAFEAIHSTHLAGNPPSCREEQIDLAIGISHPSVGPSWMTRSNPSTPNERSKAVNSFLLQCRNPFARSSPFTRHSSNRENPGYARPGVGVNFKQ